MLVYDEIFLRESFNVSSQTLTYCGLEDFGGEVDSCGLNANHALVFMYQSLAINFTQSIAVFTSRGPVKRYLFKSIIFPFSRISFPPLRYTLVLQS